MTAILKQCALLVFISCSIAGVAQPRIRVHTVVGFNGLVKLGRLNSVLIEVENRGTTGTFTVEASVRRGATARVGRASSIKETLILESGSTRRLLVTLPVESGAMPVSVEVRSNNELVDSVEHELAGRVVRTPLVVVIGRRAGFDFLIPDATVTYPHPELLPNRWDGYLAADLVVLHDIGPDGLSPDQIAAIATWVEFGGSLLVVGGSHLPRLPSDLAELLDVSVSGLDRLPAETLADSLGIISPGANREITISRLVGVGDGNHRQGTELIETSERIVLARSEPGAGSVVVTSFDIAGYPFEDTAVRREAFASFGVAPGAVDVEIDPGSLFDQTVLNTLVATVNPNPSPRLVFFLAAVAWILVTGGCLALLARRPRSALGWFVSTVIFAAATAGSWYGSTRLQFRPAYLFAGASVATYHPGAHHALVAGDFAMISITRGDRRLTVEDNRASIFPLGRSSLTITRNSGSLEVPLAFDSPWSVDALRLVAAVPWRIEAETRVTDATIEVSVTNSSADLIRDAVLLYRGSVRPVGPLAPGSSIEERFRRSSAPVAASVREYAESNTGLDPVQEALLVTVLVDDRWRDLLESDAVLLVGRLDRALVAVRTEESYLHQVSHDALVIVLEVPGEGVDSETIWSG